MRSIVVHDFGAHDSCRSNIGGCARQRMAFTLVEMIVAISMIGSLLILIGGMFALLMRSESSVMNSISIERTIARLSEQFRKDIHQSRSIPSAEAKDGELSELILPGRANTAIRYHVTKRGIERQLISQDSVTARDTFVLPDCQVHFEQGSGPESAMRSIVILRPGALMQRTPHAPIPRRRLEIQSFMNSGTLETVPKTQEETKSSEKVSQ